MMHFKQFNVMIVSVFLHLQLRVVGQHNYIRNRRSENAPLSYEQHEDGIIAAQKGKIKKSSVSKPESDPEHNERRS